MKRSITRLAMVAVAVTATIGVAGCGDSKDEAACRAAYIAEQKAKGLLAPTTEQAREACDRDRGGTYARNYYGSRKGSGFRGGGSGSGK
ncbi:hypothetical protein [Yimella sp. cx-51]|uniref:hypothetical protein n=1 Tax=Yimella sp. cx-51 TaxID=2770551 RepID=UPI00165DF5A1|nr:hypothetical protein [Yimella sp. cx-51]MBC9957148.1 hypothetical protein [Yimella sp. cx-51]MBD2758459.1 hypothetical protein [Yimella sp. cx-573]QTH37201.1 hypothetical protein J5M86_09825 [Yimella sp. cx-51]